MLTEKKKNDILAFFWLCLSVLVLLCLVSYEPDDIAFNTSVPNNPVHNFVGLAGARVSWFLNFVIGGGSYFLVALLCFWALAQWTGKKSQNLWLKILSGAIFFVSSCAFLSLVTASNPSAQFQAGGVVGYFSASWMKVVFGQASIFVAMFLFVLSLLLATEFMVFPLILGAFGLLKKWIQGEIKGDDPKSKKEDMALDAGTSKLKLLFGKKPQKIKIRGEGIEEKPSALDKAKALLKKPEVAAVKPKPEPIKITKKEVLKAAPEPAAAKPIPRAKGDYQLPPLSLLDDVRGAKPTGDSTKRIEEFSRILQDTLADFGIDAKVVEAEQGPVITRFELQPASGIKLQRITALQDNIALALQATSIRILAPIPGKARIGIEVPNAEKSIVTLKSILASEAMRRIASKIAIAMGKDAAGEPLIADLDQMPHMLIAGSTGSGKTVCMNTIITSILFRATPDEVKFVMIDPKMVELACYNGIPHLLTPVLTQVEKVPAVLAWLVAEMQRRYTVLSKTGVRDVETYNEKVSSRPVSENKDKEKEKREETMPYIVVIIDELADLMMSQGKEVEAAIMRLAQLARAVGIHMILATQRPSVDVITGVIKANFPARVAFQVASKVDSRTVLDANGADCLLGKGDMLFQDPGKPNMIRGQGAWVSDAEIQRLVDFIKKQQEPLYHEEILAAAPKKTDGNQDFRSDEHYEEACRIIVTSGQASVSMLQRKLGLGYTRAARLVDMMEEDGIVGPHRGAKPREILMTLDDLEARQAAASAPKEQAKESK